MHQGTWNAAALFWKGCCPIWSWRFTILTSPEINDISFWSFPQDANIGRKEWTCGYSKWVWLKIIEPWNIKRLKKTDYLLVLEFSSLEKKGNPCPWVAVSPPANSFSSHPSFLKTSQQGKTHDVRIIHAVCFPVRCWYQSPMELHEFIISSGWSCSKVRDDEKNTIFGEWNDSNDDSNICLHFFNQSIFHQKVQLIPSRLKSKTPKTWHCRFCYRWTQTSAAHVVKSPGPQTSTRGLSLGMRFWCPATVLSRKQWWGSHRNTFGLTEM